MSVVARSLIAIILLLAGCTCPPDPGAESEEPILSFPILEPIANAQPDVRFTTAVHVPTEIDLRDEGDSLVMSYAKFNELEVSIGKNLLAGIRRETYARVDGVEKFLGLTLQGGSSFELNDLTFVRGRWGVPDASTPFILVEKLTLFETDVPTQHRWSPTSGNHYQVLWTRTFERPVQ